MIGERHRVAALAEPLRGPRPRPEASHEMETGVRPFGRLGALLEQPRRVAERAQLD